MALYIIDGDEESRTATLRATAHLPYSIESFDCAEAFLADAPASRVGCVVSEVRLRELSGLMLQERLLAMEAPLSLVFLSHHADIPLAVRAMRGGAIDVLEKPVDEHRLLDAIYRGVQRSLQRHGLRAERDSLRGRFDELTQREREVIDRIVAGETNKSIALALNISPQAVDARRTNAMGKLGARSLAEVVRLATSLRYLQPLLE